METQKKIWKNDMFRNYGQILLGCLLGAIAYPLFLVPSSIAPGGLTGVATILNVLFGLPVGITSLIMNIPLFLIGYKQMGHVFVLRTLGATVLFSVLIDILPLKPLTDDLLLGSLYGGVFLGAGIGLILRGGATTGGTDMIAKMVQKRFSFIPTGTFLFAIDFCVVLAAGFAIDMKHALYAFLCIFTSSKVLDMVVAGVNTAKACYIMSEHWEPILQDILHGLGRGCTMLKAQGAWSKQEKPVLLCIVSRVEVPQIKQIVLKEDEKAFLFITDAFEALGEGFQKLEE